ncbi:SIMPL domain-containing protein [Acidocella sp.]|uniref:SIMPL domain-containing protein n=1 Tax=Acidocella sp. TaxID=50710 RepID=UPI00262B4F27|nr:SIMPL domain-containing protein [Acidocella sp.]
MNRTVCMAVLAGLLAGPAAAQTVLNLSETGHASTPPDQAVAQFILQASAASAATAQDMLNSQAKTALAAARAVAGVAATTSGYATSTQPSTPGNPASPPVYTASQALTLVMPAAGGVPPAAFAGLLTRLQQRGVMLEGLGGGLSDAAQARLQQAAIANAISQLQTQAAAIAAQLHQTVGRLKTLTISAAPPPMPMMMGRLAMAAPQSAPGPSTASADVTAEIELDKAP